MSQLATYLAVTVSIVAALMSVVGAFVSYRMKRRFEDNVLQARGRKLPPTANTAEPSGDTTMDTGEADE
jgi:hypothetical protein